MEYFLFDLHHGLYSCVFVPFSVDVKIAFFNQSSCDHPCVTIMKLSLLKSLPNGRDKQVPETHRAHYPSVTSLMASSSHHKSYIKCKSSNPIKLHWYRCVIWSKNFLEFQLPLSTRILTSNPNKSTALNFLEVSSLIKLYHQSLVFTAYLIMFMHICMWRLNYLLLK